MKRAIILCWAIFLSTSAQSQWQTLNVPNVTTFGRYDDICFINDSVGWAIGSIQNGDAHLYKTIDTGNTWATVDTFPFFLRCVRFLSNDVGIIGTLSATAPLLVTTDGGLTWHNVADTMAVKPRAICGLSAGSQNVVYGCGAYMGFPCLIKSTDSGVNWSYKNMSSYAHALVDVLFINEQEGFLGGVAIGGNSGSVILRTTDGGATWTEVYKSNGIAEEYNWKIFRLDEQHYYSAIDSYNPSAPTTITSSRDAGMTWDTIVVSKRHFQLQCVGFIDTLRGFAGGYDPFVFFTEDGGASWDSIMLGNNFNRFWHGPGPYSFLTGLQIYRFTDTVSQIIDTTHATSVNQMPSNSYRFEDALDVFPNPSRSQLNLEVNLAITSFIKLQILSSTGTTELNVQNNEFVQGKHSFKVDVSSLMPGVHYALLHTHIGVIIRPFVVSK